MNECETDRQEEGGSQRERGGEGYLHASTTSVSHQPRLNYIQVILKMVYLSLFFDNSLCLSVYVLCVSSGHNY